MILFHGTSGAGSPDPRQLDAFIGSRMQHLGFKGTRKRRECLFATTCCSYVLEYANTSLDVRIVKPHHDSIVTWCTNVTDVLVEVQHYFDCMYLNDTTLGSGRTSQIISDLVTDCAGCIDTLNQYYANNRLKRVITMIVDDFLSKLDINEVAYSEIGTALDKHKGEVWITGPCELIDL